jgi:hypothetical protein
VVGGTNVHQDKSAFSDVPCTFDYVLIEQALMDIRSQNRYEFSLQYYLLYRLWFFIPSTWCFLDAFSVSHHAGSVF